MKKILFVMVAIIIIIVATIGIKILLDYYSEEQQNSTVEDYLNAGWEIEQEYNYNGTIPEEELQYLQENVVEEEKE